MAEPIQIHDWSLRARLRGVSRWRVPDSVQREVLRFLHDLELGKVNRGRRISEARRVKYLTVLRTPLEFFRKPTSCLTVNNIEAFENALVTGKVKCRLKKRPYAHSSMVDIRKALRIFLRWRLGAAKATKLAGWLDTRDRAGTPDFLSDEEIERLYQACRTVEQRFVVAVLFDSGARATEFHNIRLEDIRMPTGKDNFVRLVLKTEYSKTLGRTISLYWKFSLEALKVYLEQRVREGVKPTDPVYAGRYDQTRQFLYRLGRDVLQRKVHYHLFRHSSATHYANKMNRQELCYRYGWRFSSDMPDIYISRAGMKTKDLDEKFTATEVQALQSALEDVKQKAGLKDERILELQQAVAKMQRDFESVTKVLAMNRSLEEVEAALERKRTMGVRNSGVKNEGRSGERLKNPLFVIKR